MYSIAQLRTRKYLKKATKVIDNRKMRRNLLKDARIRGVEVEEGKAMGICADDDLGRLVEGIQGPRIFKKIS